MSDQTRRDNLQSIHEDMRAINSEMHALKSEMLRLERMILQNEKHMQPVVEVYKKIVASSEVGGFVAKIIGGFLGVVGAIASLWLILKGGGSSGGG